MNKLIVETEFLQNFAFLFLLALSCLLPLDLQLNACARLFGNMFLRKLTFFTCCRSHLSEAYCFDWFWWKFIKISNCHVFSKFLFHCIFTFFSRTLIFLRPLVLSLKKCHKPTKFYHYSLKSIDLKFSNVSFW